MNVKKIVKAYLETNGYDGLCNRFCWCKLENLMNNYFEDCITVCEPGYIHIDELGEWKIKSKKPVETKQKTRKEKKK